MTIIVIGGIRTHYIKINAFQKVVDQLDKELKDKFNFIYVDSAQHYDIALNGFIDELGIKFDYQLKHENHEPYQLLTSMMTQLGLLFDEISKATRIDYVIVFGDVATTALSAMSALFKSIRVAHIEAGARIGRGVGGEEYYRTMTDHIATKNFATTYIDYENLCAEGIRDRSYFVGDIIYDYTKTILNNIDRRSFFYYSGNEKRMFDTKKNFVLCSLHHVENIDKDYLSDFFCSIQKYSYNYIFIAHPRIKKFICSQHINTYNCIIADYIPYREYLIALSQCEFVITDSGGIQREAYYFNKRCIVRSYFNIWKSIIECESNISIDKNITSLCKAIEWAEAHKLCKYEYDGCFGDGTSIKKILSLLLEED